MRMMKLEKRQNKALALAGCVALTVMLIATAAIAAGPNPTQVGALAFYSALTGTDDLPDNQVNYNVIDPILISQILGGVEWSVPRDCDDMEANDDTYMYLQYLDGTRKVYHIFLGNSHISLKDNRSTCFYVDPATQGMIEANAQ